MSGQFALWPPTASAHAGNVDTLVLAFSALIVLLSAPVFILIVVFALKYRRGRSADRAHPPDRNVWLETSWSAIPFALMLFFFVWSTWLFFRAHRAPANALEIHVVAKQWMWKFQHPGGQREINDLHAPVGEPVLLTMTSEDVVHSLFLPALRLKQDVLPGRYTSLWFVADKSGVYALACSQFCGTDHAEMGGRLHLLEAQDYARWLATSDVDQSLAAQGESLFRSLGCSGCHGPSSTVHAPPLEGLAGSTVMLDGGGRTQADDAYLRDSILLPNKQIVAGYPAIMPTYQNVIGEDQIILLIAYLKSLGGRSPS